MSEKENTEMKRFEEYAKSLGLEAGVEIIRKHNETKKQWDIVITRNGYRKAVKNTDTYVRHVVYPIYDNTEIRVDGCYVKAIIRGNMNNLMGAIGFLWKKDDQNPIIWQVSADDYEHMDTVYWKSMRCTMLVKVCEVGLCRLAYPELFSGTYETDELALGNDDTPNETITKKEMIRYIQQNILISNEFMDHNSVKIDNLTFEEVSKIYHQTKEIVDASNAKD